MSVFAKTEIDVLRESIRKTVLIPTEDPTTLESVDGAEITKPREQMKLGIKIWTAMGKFIRSQCNKGRVIDSLNFGTFAKASTVKKDQPDADSYYIYCTGPNSPFDLIKNNQNVTDVDQSVLEEKLIQLNYSSIASVCRCTPDSVKGLLTRVKDDVIDFVKNKNHSLNLNFMVGQLSLNASGTAEFKSGNANLETMSTFTSMLPADMRSQVSHGDRSIRGMQDQQSNSTNRDAANNSAAANNAKNRTTGGSAFTNKKKWMKEGRTSQDEGTDEYGHLSKFLQDQISSRSSKQRSITGSNRSKANNAIIEQAAKVRHDLKAVQELAEQHGAMNVGKVKIPKDFNKDIRQKQRDERSEQMKAQEEFNQEQAASAQQTPRDNMSSCSQDRYGVSKVRVSASRQKELRKRNAISSQRQVLENNIVDTMPHTHVHRPPYESPAHPRHKTVDGGSMTPQIMTSQGKLMPSTMEVNMDFDRTNIPEERGLYRHSDSKINNIISRALNRKNVSYAYHTGYPGFMHSQGPYAVYGHAKHKGEKVYQDQRGTRKAAYSRFEDDLVKLTNERDKQRDHFFNNIKEEQNLAIAQRQFQMQTNKQNQEYILRQISEDQERRRRQRDEDVEYKKPHFGPEETVDVIEKMYHEELDKKRTVLTNLKAQMAHREESREENTRLEKQADRENLNRFIEMQNAENQAQREKIMNEKRTLKKAWEKQHALRTEHETRDRAFQ